MQKWGLWTQEGEKIRPREKKESWPSEKREEKQKLQKEIRKNLNLFAVTEFPILFFANRPQICVLKGHASRDFERRNFCNYTHSADFHFQAVALVVFSVLWLQNFCSFFCILWEFFCFLWTVFFCILSVWKYENSLSGLPKTLQEKEKAFRQFVKVANQHVYCEPWYSKVFQCESNFFDMKPKSCLTQFSSLAQDALFLEIQLRLRRSQGQDDSTNSKSTENMKAKTLEK